MRFTSVDELLGLESDKFSFANESVDEFTTMEAFEGMVEASANVAMIGKAIDMRLSNDSVYSTESNIIQMIGTGIANIIQWIIKKLKDFCMWVRGIWSNITGETKRAEERANKAAKEAEEIRILKESYAKKDRERYQEELKEEEERRTKFTESLVKYKEEMLNKKLGNVVYNEIESEDDIDKLEKQQSEVIKLINDDYALITDLLTNPIGDTDRLNQFSFDRHKSVYETIRKENPGRDYMMRNVNIFCRECEIFLEKGGNYTQGIDPSNSEELFIKTSVRQLENMHNKLTHMHKYVDEFMKNHVNNAATESPVINFGNKGSNVFSNKNNGVGGNSNRLYRYDNPRRDDVLHYHERTNADPRYKSHSPSTGEEAYTKYNTILKAVNSGLSHIEKAMEDIRSMNKDITDTTIMKVKLSNKFTSLVVKMYQHDDKY